MRWAMVGWVEPGWGVELERVAWSGSGGCRIRSGSGGCRLMGGRSNAGPAETAAGPCLPLSEPASVP